MMLFSNEKENMDAAIAGATARCMDATVWARPFIAPSIPLGAVDEMYMKVQPDIDGKGDSENPQPPACVSERGRYVPYAMHTPVEHIIWMSTRTQRTMSVPAYCARVPLIGKRRKEGTRPEMRVMSVQRSPKNLRMWWKTVSWRMPLRIPNMARQTPMRVGSKPSPPS